MATGLLSVGVSGLLVSQRALGTTGHNITNVNTEGYSRQQVEFGTRVPQRSGDGFIGKGVEVNSITRVYDDFLVGQLRTATSNTEAVSNYHELVSQIDNLLADDSGGLLPAMQSFFSATQDVAGDPSSIPARQVMMSTSQSLVDRFHTLEQRLADMREATNGQMQVIVGEVNTLADGVADLNDRISLLSGSAGGQLPNDLMDQRDELIRQLSEHVNVSVIAQGNNAVNLSIGTGQALVVGSTATHLSIVRNEFDPTIKEIAVGATRISSGSVTGGRLAGLLDANEQVIDPVQNALGRVAVAVSQAFNDQHQLGVDLSGISGDLYFNDLGKLSPRVLNSEQNLSLIPVDIQVSVTDITQLSTSDYRLERQGSRYLLTRLSDNKLFEFTNFPAAPETLDGLTFELNAGSLTDGDRYLIQPTRSAARQLDLAITDARSIAAAAPIRSIAGINNTGTARISQGSANSVNNELVLDFTSATTFDVTDATTGATLAIGEGYTSGASILFNGLSFDISGVPAGGDRFTVNQTVTSSDSSNTGSGQISQALANPPALNLTDTVNISFGAAVDSGAAVPASMFNDALPTADTLAYGLDINGSNVYSAVTAPPAATLNDLATDINAAAIPNITATVQAGSLLLVNSDPAAGNINITETISGFTNGEGDSIDGYFATGITGVTGANTVLTSLTPTSPPNTFTVTGATAGSPTIAVPYTTGDPISFNGWTVNIEGVPQVGDNFSVEANTSGSGDNRNILAMADLQFREFMDNGSSTFQDAYSIAVVDVGTLTQQAEINLNAQQTLLLQAQENREGLSGVNLDEEAANLLRYQQVYQASAQVISTADNIFQTLLEAIR